MSAPRGWSKEGSRRLGIPRPDYQPDEPCYYCGIPGCTECGAPPMLLARSLSDQTIDVDVDAKPAGWNPSCGGTADCLCSSCYDGPLGCGD